MISAKVKKVWSGVEVKDFDPYKDALQARLINLIWNNESLKHEMINNPKVVFERETGITFPSDLEIKVLEENDDTFYFVIPPLPSNKAKWEQFYQQMSVWWTLTYTWWYWMYQMNVPNSEAFREVLESLIIVRFMQDESLMKALLANPNSTLEKQAGVTLPTGVKVQPLLETPNLAYFVLPKNSQVEKLKQTELGTYWIAAHTWFWWLTSLRIRTVDF